MPGLEPAAVLNGRYRVLRPIGRGGMGAVYEAIDLRLSHAVAVKEMTAAGDEAMRAFEREARLLASLRHQTLPVVSDYFIESGARYLVMQFIEGENLARLSKRTGLQASDDVVRWGIAILKALVYLHGHEPPIVHRDIKPANITLTPRGEVVLLDFGLAKGSPANQTRIEPEEPSIYGFTPGYAPPEQLAAAGTDARSDLYALAATLYHLACGAPPPGAGDRLHAVESGRPDLFSIDERTPMPTRLAAVLRRALALEPSARFQSAAEMLEALDTTAPLRAVEPRPAPAARSRRLDAAAPSEAEVGREIDLLVQVRFADSPRLGLEDWPTRRRPAQIEQASEAVAVEHPVHPATGQKLPARLRIRLVAPDFDIRGASEQLIDVPPDEYSRRLAFLLAPRHLGYCRVNVEVYSAADAVFLGSVAVEADALASLAAVPERRVAALALGVSGVPADASAPRADEATPAPPLARRDDFGRKRAAEIERQLAAARAAVEAGDLEGACAVARPDAATLRDFREDERRLEEAARNEEARRMADAQAEALGRDDEERTMVTSASERRPVSIGAEDPAPLGVNVEALPPPAARRVPQWMYGAASAAMIVLAVIVFRSTGAIDTSAPPPTASAPPPVATPAATPATPSATAPAAPATTPKGPAPAVTPPAAPSAPTAVRPSPAPASPAPATPAPAPAASPSPGPTAPPAVAPPSIDRSMTVTSTTVPGVSLQLVEMARAPGVVRLRLRIVNDSSSNVDASIATAGSQLVVAGNRYRIVSDRPGAGAREAASLPAGAAAEHIMEFRVPDTIAGSCDVILTPGSARAAAFPPIRCALPPR